jgi:hypothetical protein
MDGTDRLVFACTNSCNPLGEDETGRLFVWTEVARGEGSVGTLGGGQGGAESLAPWSESPPCTSDANVDTTGDTIAISAGCTSIQVFAAGVAAKTPLSGHAFPGVQIFGGAEHIQYAAGRVFLRGMLSGSHVSTAPLHIMSMAADGSDVRDLDVGDDAADFVVSNDAGFVLVSHQTSATDGGASTYSIVAHAGTTRMPIPGLGSIPSFGAVTLAWTPH